MIRRISIGPEESFFSLASMKQPVNQWLCIAFLSLWCFWIVLYYATEHARIIGAEYVSGVTDVLNTKTELKSGNRYK
jgi:hypothetical protein